MDKKFDLKSVIAKQIEEFEKNRPQIQAQIEAKARSNKNCLTYWYPVIQSISEIKTPETYWFPIHYKDQIDSLEGKISEDLTKTIELLKEKAKILGYPVFIKNSLFSGKHNWQHTCFVEKEEDLLEHFKTLTDMAYAFGVDDSMYWVIRKYLKPDALIWTDSQMPVTFERRYFTEDGKVSFHHPYWPEKALLNQNPTPENWKELLVITNHESDEEIKLLSNLTQKVADVLPGSWSVDWLKVGNQWYLIDMAEKHKSFIWADYVDGKKGL